MQAPDKLLLSTLKSSALKDYVEETKLIALQVMEMASSDRLAVEGTVWTSATSHTMMDTYTG